VVPIYITSRETNIISAYIVYKVHDAWGCIETTGCLEAAGQVHAPISFELITHRNAYLDCPAQRYVEAWVWVPYSQSKI
jgi:hypothetical protein